MAVDIELLWYCENSRNSMLLFQYFRTLEILE